MFKKSKRKIVAAILSVLVILLAGSFGVIYLASYTELTRENRKLLEQYVEAYALWRELDTQVPRMGEQEKIPDRRHLEPPALELSTFYSVAIADDGKVLKVDTADISTLDDETLTQLAFEILEKGESQGMQDHLIYRMQDKGGYTLVAFLDNTLILESAGTLISYTLIWGGVTLVLLFFLARYLANRIVAPLEESYQRQKQFISDAGHELKTPVAVVNANVELLQREMGENQWLSNIQYENERMSGLILQLLDLARTENVVPQMENVDFSRLVYGEMLPFEAIAYENGLTLEGDITENLYVLGNTVQLKQLTSILLDNAARHSAEGSRIGVTLKKEKSKAVLIVSNDGEEIPKEQRERMFERFYRLDTARTGEDRHYGLGLAIAKAIADTHKGSIEIRCQEGKVEFLVKIPLLKMQVL